MAVSRLRIFLTETVWLEEIESLPLHKRAIYRVGRIGYIVVKGVTDERLNQQAAALTYVSFLSILPLMAVLFSLAKGFGFQEKVRPWIQDALRLVDPEILDKIIQYVSETDVAAMGAIGFLFLLWSVLKTLLWLEKSFNQIWSVNNARPLYRALAYYLSVVLIVPLLVAASSTFLAIFQTADPESGIMSWARSVPGLTAVLGWLESFVPFGITWVAFSLVYAFMVNTQVRLRMAVSGAFVSSLLWSLLQWLYFESQIMLSKNALYSTFAFLPIFLIFLFFSWLVLLFGCRVAFALQHEGSFRKERIARAAGLQFRIAAGLALLQVIARRFHAGETVLDPKEVADQLDLSLPLTLEMLAHLERAGILHRVRRRQEEPDGPTGLVPARALDKIPIQEAIVALEQGAGKMDLPGQALSGPLREILDRKDLARAQAMEGITALDLVDQGKED